MKKKGIIQLAVVSVVMTLFFTSCHNNSSSSTTLVGDWFRLSDFDGVARTDAASFVIGNKGYLGTGIDENLDRLSDLWVYDPAKNFWSQKANIPDSVGRNGAVGFAADGKGYIGLGYDGLSRLKDFYCYNPTTNSWSRIKSIYKVDTTYDTGGKVTSIDTTYLPGRIGAIAFGIDNYGYVGTGYDGNYEKDFWKYDPSKNTWSQLEGFGGAKRRDGNAFVINGKAYICDGEENANYDYDLWEYNPTTDTWTQKRDIKNSSSQSYDDNYTGIIGVNKVSFTINGKGYLATGGTGVAGILVWEYDPDMDLWTQKTSFEGTGRINAVSFSIGNYGYVATGNSSSVYFDDLWGFDPTAQVNANDN